jgi:hypothetical protein
MVPVQVAVSVLLLVSASLLAGTFLHLMLENSGFRAEGVTMAPYWRMLVEEYYELMGWERTTGKPLPATLRKLRMSEYLKDLKKF